MANSIIHFLFFVLFFSLFEPDLGLRLRIAGSLSRELPSSGAASLLRGLPSSGAVSLPRGLPSSGAASLPEGLPSFGAALLPGDYRLSVRHRYRGNYRLSKQDASFRVLQGRLRIAGWLSRGLSSSGAVSLPGGLPSFEAECFRSLQGGGVIVSS